MPRILALVLALGLIPPLGAQAARTGYSAFVGAGASSVRTGTLDDQLAANGYPTFGNSGPSVNLSAYRLFSRGLMLGGEWHFIDMGNGRYQGREVGLGAGYGTLGFGFAVSPASRVRLYPRLGIGVGGMGLWRENVLTATSVALDDWLAAPSSDPAYVTLSQASMVLDFGAGAEVALRRRGLAGPVLGLRFGYVATPFDQGWTVDGRAVTGAPESTVAGPYFRVLLGWRRERAR